MLFAFRSQITYFTVTAVWLVAFANRFSNHFIIDTSGVHITNVLLFSISSVCESFNANRIKSNLRTNTRLRVQHTRSHRLRILAGKRIYCAIRFQPTRTERPDGNCFRRHMALGMALSINAQKMSIISKFLAYIAPLHFRRQTNPNSIQSNGIFSTGPFRSAHIQWGKCSLECGRTVGLRLKRKRHHQNRSFAPAALSLTFIFLGTDYWHTTIDAPHEICLTIVNAVIPITIPSIFADTDTLEAFRAVRALIAIPFLRRHHIGRGGRLWHFRGSSLLFFIRLCGG